MNGVNALSTAIDNKMNIQGTTQVVISCSNNQLFGVWCFWSIAKRILNTALHRLTLVSTGFQHQRRQLICIEICWCRPTRGVAQGKRATVEVTAMRLEPGRNWPGNQVNIKLTTRCSRKNVIYTIYHGLSWYIMVFLLISSCRMRSPGSPLIGAQAFHPLLHRLPCRPGLACLAGDGCSNEESQHSEPATRTAAKWIVIQSFLRCKKTRRERKTN